MIGKKRLLPAVIAGANALTLTAALVLTLTGGAIARSQSYNSSALKWDPDGESTQVSVFLSEDAGFDTDSVNSLRVHLNSELGNIATDGQGNVPEIPDAYSTPVGKAQIQCDTTGRGEAELTAVGGEFFIFRDFKLLSGAYFSDDDLMQDGAVIERSLAWTLYGSSNIAGQLIYIDGVQFYISGVIDDPTDKYEKRTAGESPRVYISYKGAAQLPQVMYSPTAADGASPALKKITCYECIMLDPVENFAYNTINKYFGNMYEGKFHAVNNSERFSSSEMVKAYKKRSDLAVRTDTVVYPYWENASRIAEFRLSPLYYWRRLCFVIPLLTAVWLIWRLIRLIKKSGIGLASSALEKYKTVVYSRKQKKDNI